MTIAQETCARERAGQTEKKEGDRMRILIAEDNETLADCLQFTLRNAGHATERVDNGSDADAALAASEYDLLILDLGLPRLPGLDVLRLLRARGSNVPVLVLSASGEIAQRVGALDLGADDYLTKPFAIRELEARSRALRRRGLGMNRPPLRGNGALAFDPAARMAYVQGRALDLSAREVDVLEIFLARIGRVVSKDQLLGCLSNWGDAVSRNAVEVYVHRLRRKLQSASILISTVRGLGYCMEKASGLPADSIQPGVTGGSRT
jgi:two-component system, OmpR family, response regulator